MIKKHSENSIIIVLDCLRSAYNTGNIFRLADAVGAKEIIACGYTPAPPHPKLTKTAMGAETMVPCRQFETSLQAIEQLRTEGVRNILAVETFSEGTLPWKYQFKFPLALVLGNEALGIQADTITKCDGIITLPMTGTKTSINVGNCAAVVLYSVMAYLDLNDYK